MDTREALKSRRSIRVFDNKAIPKKEIEEIIDAARYAPTARNVQPWHFIAIADKDKLKEIGRIASDNASFISNCAACIAVFCQDTKYYLEDGCAATVNILLCAHSLGIGSCWVAADKKPYCGLISKITQAPENLKLVSLVALGYPKEPINKQPEKKPLDEILHWDKF